MNGKHRFITILSLDDIKQLQTVEFGMTRLFSLFLAMLNVVFNQLSSQTANAALLDAYQVGKS